MRTHDGYDAWDSYERAEDAMGENFHNGHDDIDSNGRIFQEGGKTRGGSVMRTHDGYDA